MTTKKKKAPQKDVETKESKKVEVASKEVKEVTETKKEVSKSEKPVETKQEVREKKEVLAKEPVIVPEEKSLTVKISRDEQGRLTLQAEGQAKRIAGTDDAFPEVARQFGAEIVKERLI